HGNGVYERRIGVAGLFDYRPLSFESPSDGAKILAGSTISGITASIQNSGSIAQTDSFDVTYRILKGSTELFSSTRRIAGLDQSETREVSFEGNFTPLDSGLHVLQLISLAADQISFNDTLTGLLTVVLSSPIASARVTKLGCPYAEISGGSPGPSGDDRQAAIPLPFRLTYDGHTYDSLQLSTNGWIELGTGTSGSLYGLSTPAQIGPAGASNNGRLGTIQRPTKALGPWWEDLSTGFSGTIGEVSYKTLDSAPNRIFVVQWKNMLAFFDSTTTTTRINFQLRLYETSNVIEYHYGPVIAGTFGGSGAGASLGLKDHIGGDYHFYDIARNGTAAAADVITYLNPLTGWPGQDGCYRIENVVTAVSDMNAPQLPSQIYLGQNYPNPFNPKTNFGFRIVDFGLVTLKVYDVLGREVATIVNEVLPPGHYSRTWDATDAASGIYLYKMRAGSFNETKKMMLIR
ncbi:MAG TPA: T9SS type A sorting domain-containing protein, partial [Bacteroidota bacterium]|nr:T9SS type A sorting domain-containing protein [Bacteroidota bacterium]